MSPAAATAFTTAKALLFGQHQELRGLLRTGAVLAGAASRGDRPCLNELPNLIETLKVRFTGHLSFEEATLAPLLQKGDPASARRADQLAKEHRRQVSEFQILLELAGCSGDPQTIAFSFQGLLNSLLSDMDEEERWLLQISETSDQAKAVSSP